MRLPSLPKLGFLLPILALATAGLVGCDGDDGHHHDWAGGDQGGDESTTTMPVQVTIDTGATIDATGGNGVGVFVQYAAGGHWTVTTACDTTTSQQSCGFDVFIGGVGSTTGATDPKDPNQATSTTTAITNIQTVDPNGDPLGFEMDQGVLHVSTNTSVNLDGFTFDTPAGATIELELYLDQVAQPRFVYWIGDKVLHTGAPTDPVDFAPTAM
jgi:hypothetical protein